MVHITAVSWAVWCILLITIDQQQQTLALAFSTVPSRILSPREVDGNHQPIHRRFTRCSCLCLSGDFESKTSRRAIFRRGILLPPAVLVAFTSAITTPATTAPALALALLVGEGEQRMEFTRRPKAPTAALIPAVQQRQLLARCLAIVAKLEKKEVNNKNEKELLLQNLYKILPSLTDATPTKHEKGQAFNTGYNNIYDSDLAVLLQYNPATQLSGSLARAAMNVYTANLNYYGSSSSSSNTAAAPSYTVTDPEWKKSYIRANDGLPDVKQVIQADLDLRNLYRNQVQLKLEDASAELYYGGGASSSISSSSSNSNSSSGDGDINTEELALLLRQAADYFDLWFNKISNDDVKQSIQAALEGKSLRVYASYSAGFRPTINN